MSGPGCHLHDLGGEPLIVLLLDANEAVVDGVLAVRVKARGNEDEVRLEAHQRRQNLVAPRPPPRRHTPTCPHTSSCEGVPHKQARSRLELLLPLSALRNVLLASLRLCSNRFRGATGRKIVLTEVGIE